MVAAIGAFDPPSTPSNRRASATARPRPFINGDIHIPATNPSDLKPAALFRVVDGSTVPLLNADAVIQLVSKADTPAAKDLYLTYQAAEEVLRRAEPWLSDETRRGRAISYAMKEDGVEPAFLD